MNRAWALFKKLGLNCYDMLPYVKNFTIHVSRYGVSQAMKINAKIGGINWVVSSQPAAFMNKPYIVFGERVAIP